MFEIKGAATNRFHPFAKQFGKLIRDEMTRIYNNDNNPDQVYAKSVVRPALTAIRRAAGRPDICDKWITTGRCRQRDCMNSHPDWPTEWDGAWLHQHCGELLALVKVPATWQPT